MLFHILPKSIPKVVFAHMYATNDYRISHQKENLTEITYFESGNASCRFEDGCVRELPPESISIHFYRQPATFYSKEYHRHFTVAFQMDYEFVSENTEGAVHLDDLITDMKFVAEASKIIRHCTRDILLYDQNACKTTAEVFELFALYQHRYADHTLYPPDGNINPHAINYVKQAKEYILHNISVKFSVSDIARSLGLSRGYLSNIFKSVSGTSIVRYINEVRLEIVKNLCLNESASLSEACASVGIDDPNYISRMFRKYYDTTLRDIKSSKSR